MRIFTLIKGLLYRLNLIADFVVEEGKSNGWTYQKWASGIAECWITSVTCTANYASGALMGGYYAQSQTPPEIPAFPFTFVGDRSAVGTGRLGSGTGFVNASTSTTRIASLTIVGNQSSKSMGVQMLRVTGRWK